MSNENPAYQGEERKIITKMNYSASEVEEIFQLGLYAGYKNGLRDGVNTVRRNSSWEMAGEVRQVIEETKQRLPKNIGRKALDELLEKLPKFNPQAPQIR